MGGCFAGGDGGREKIHRDRAHKGRQGLGDRTGSQRHRENQSLMRDKGGDEVGWRGRERGEAERAEKEAGGGRVRERLFLLAFAQEAGGPGRCSGGRSRVAVGQWVLVGKLNQ